MNIDRRTTISSGAAITALFATGARAQQSGAQGASAAMPDSPTTDPAEGPSGLMEIIHVWADDDGVSHVERLKVQGSPKKLPVVGVAATSIAQSVEDWHIAPSKTFTINVVGDIEAEVSDGTKVRIGKGDLVYLEDRKGKGHITRLLTPVANLFMRMPDDFDIKAWAAGPPTENLWD